MYKGKDYGIFRTDNKQRRVEDCYVWAMQMGRRSSTTCSMDHHWMYSLITILEFLTENNIDFVCHDDIPYTTADVDDAYKTCKDLGKFVATKRTEGISTTDVVTKILYNKQMYYIRNIKRGVPRSKLGISWIRYVWLRSKILFCPQPDYEYKKKKWCL